MCFEHDGSGTQARTEIICRYHEQTWADVGSIWNWTNTQKNGQQGFSTWRTCDYNLDWLSFWHSVGPLIAFACEIPEVNNTAKIHITPK